MIHPYYNKTKFPLFICHHGNWDIYANDTGKCAALPSELGEKSGCRASYFGDLDFLESQVKRGQMPPMSETQAQTISCIRSGMKSTLVLDVQKAAHPAKLHAELPF